ncbi:MAG: hypothetical protein ACPG49_11450 [Chitinophagales bacterium]
MIRQTLDLYHLPFSEILSDVETLLKTDFDILQKQSYAYQKMLKEGKKSEQYLLSYENRLHHAQTRFEFFNELMCRLQTYDYRFVIKSVTEAKYQASKRERKDRYGFSIDFAGTLKPLVIIW